MTDEERVGFAMVSLLHITKGQQGFYALHSDGWMIDREKQHLLIRTKTSLVHKPHVLGFCKPHLRDLGRPPHRTSPGEAWDQEPSVLDAVHRIIRLFGVERCMFASNTPVDQQARSVRSGAVRRHSHQLVRGGGSYIDASWQEGGIGATCIYVMHITYIYIHYMLSYSPSLSLSFSVFLPFFLSVRARTRLEGFSCVCFHQPRGCLAS